MTTAIEQTDWTRLRALVAAVDKERPKPADLEALRQGFKEHPALWRIAGDLARQAEAHILHNIAGTPALLESVEEGMRVIRRELGYATAPMLERLLIEQVALCWLRLNLVEYAYTTVTT